MALRLTCGLSSGFEFDDRESRGWTNYAQLRATHTIKLTRAIPVPLMHRHAHHCKPSTRGLRRATFPGARHYLASEHRLR
eukprot:2882512-Pleurochrysis_carterae.AAC.1